MNLLIACTEPSDLKGDDRAAHRVDLDDLIATEFDPLLVECWKLEHERAF
jgi:hypothetical protein